MNYIYYDPETGLIKKYGIMPIELIQSEMSKGKPIILVQEVTDYNNWKVNLITKELERINPEEPIPEIPQEILDLIKITPK